MGETTHIAVVLAAKCVGRARVARADADGGDGGAFDPDGDVDALNGDAEQPEDS